MPVLIGFQESVGTTPALPFFFIGNPSPLPTDRTVAVLLDDCASAAELTRIAEFNNRLDEGMRLILFVGPG
ncbi:MAG: hypothetical protein WD645_03620, partial [Dehalococcoidia bacterium]